MGLKDTLVEGAKVQYIGFICSFKLKSDFSKAFTELGEYNTYTDFFIDAMRQYIAKHKESKTYA